MSLWVILFGVFFKISLFSVGGGYNMIPLMQQEMTARGWLAPERFMDLLAVSEATPGPIAVNLATFAGYETGGLVGALAATTGVCLPGFLLLLVLGGAAWRLRGHPLFRAAMAGLTPVLAGLLAATVLQLARVLFANVPGANEFSMTATWFPVALFVAALVLLLWRKWSPLPVLAGAALAGWAAAWMSGI